MMHFKYIFQALLKSHLFCCKTAAAVWVKLLCGRQECSAGSRGAGQAKAAQPGEL